jgi:transcriptional regulator with XRE-family HTH domain
VASLYVEFGRRLRAAREKAGLSQAQLGRLAGLSRPAISNIEAGRQHVALEQIYQFAEALDTSPSALMPEVASATDRARIPGLDREIARQGLDPALSLLVTAILSRTKGSVGGAPTG